MIEILNENEETEIIGGTIPVQAFAHNIEVNPGISQYIGETDPIFKASPAFNITNSDIINWNNKVSQSYVDTALMTKQDKLTAGDNITIENNVISSTATGGTSNYNELENKPKINNVELSGNKSLTDLGIDLSTKQDTLVSGTNIKTINNNSLLGSGNINIEAPVYSAGGGIYIDNENEISVKLGQGLFIDDNAAIRLNNDTLNKLESIATKQDTLVSGTNIKTINNESILGSGNIDINSLETYSTSETIVGTWIDGKPLYRKVINIGNLTNSSTKSVAHGLTNYTLRNISGGCSNGTTFVGISGFNDEIYVNTNVNWSTKTDRRNYVAYVILEYTKTTD